MKTDDLFKSLIRFHYENNLLNSLPYLSYGRFVDRDGSPFSEGKDNNEATKGFLVLCNGSTLVDRLIDDNMLDSYEVEKDNGERDFYAIDDYSALKQYILDQGDADGAYIFEGDRSAIVRAGEIGNRPPGLKKNISDLVNEGLPEDFVYYDGSTKPNPRNIGTKTKIALKIPLSYSGGVDVEAYQLKKSAYFPKLNGSDEGKLGLGKVTHFTKDGLAREFFFVEAPNYKGDFFSPEHKIAGMVREYNDPNDKNSRAEYLVGPSYLSS